MRVHETGRGQTDPSSHIAGAASAVVSPSSTTEAKAQRSPIHSSSRSILHEELERVLDALLLQDLVPADALRGFGRPATPIVRRAPRHSGQTERCHRGMVCRRRLRACCGRHPRDPKASTRPHRSSRLATHFRCRSGLPCEVDAWLETHSCRSHRSGDPRRGGDSFPGDGSGIGRHRKRLPVVLT
jgi:hypothetical protein